MSKRSRLSDGFALPTSVNRTEVPEDAAAAFETGGQVQPIKRATKKPATPTPKRGRSDEIDNGSRLRREERGERVAVYLPPDLAEKLRVRCATDRRSMSDAVTEALRSWL